MKPIIISIKPKWAALIRAGRKTIELRRRFPKLPGGSSAILYESSPICGLTAILRISAVHELDTKDLWRLYGTSSCVDDRQFADYFADRTVGYGIQIGECIVLPEIVPLAKLRSDFAFTAPQSWAYASMSLVCGIGLQL